jgi:uracil phosphoribosyltransferase/phosphoglycolate phosphatase-like HAD superfamily hydrolase/adenylylsulfate kinase-like enzyme
MQPPSSSRFNGTHGHDQAPANFVSASCSKPVVVGLYGLPGSGKSFLLNTLKRGLSHDEFSFYDGSHVIAEVTPGGLEAFQILQEDDKNDIRNRAMGKIKQESCDSGKCAIVSGHAMFWAEEEETGQLVCTPADLETYTHILYLDVPAEVTAGYRLNDQKRCRPAVSIAHLIKWQQAEKKQLRHLCRSHDIVFTTISERQVSAGKLIPLILDFKRHTEGLNTMMAQQRMDEFINMGSEIPETVLVFDADKTLAPQDSGQLFWELLSVSCTEGDEKFPLKSLFSSPLQYSYTAFRQAAILYDEVIGEGDYNDYCEKVARKIKIHPELLDLLHLVTGQIHSRALVLTCGLRGVWEKVLEREGLAKRVIVIGGGRSSDDLVMTPALKAALVTRLRDVHDSYVWAFGDSPLDLEMLKAANQAIVVTGDKTMRSASMDEALTRSIGKDGFRPRQVVLPSNATARLDASRLPQVHLTDQFLVESVFVRRQGLHILHATDRFAAKLLMTPMRDAAVSGPALRSIHSRVGWYLATEFCSQILGVEACPITHVQGHRTDGFRILHEPKTLIVPLMRGGEPMALGVNEALPLAMFLHAKIPSDIRHDHLRDRETIFLVDSVINTGQSILNFVQHIRNLHASIRIIVIAGVIQAKSVSTSRVAQELSRFRRLSFVALRLSDNQFTGRGNTDTGHRLFNTVHLD